MTAFETNKVDAEDACNSAATLTGQSTEISSRLRVGILGRVQGVGFRPFVTKLARQSGLSGWVQNDGDGVTIEVQGLAVDAFVTALRTQSPAPAAIRRMSVGRIPTLVAEREFSIRESSLGPRRGSEITPDLPPCDSCLAELFDRRSRRYLYPFIACSHCGPRDSTIRAVPYDRCRTAMVEFPLCQDCAAEYRDPSDRRYHAEATACPACGPSLSHSIADVVSYIVAGGVVALKGVGGFHLLCDAANGAAVARLRSDKARGTKPFAVMAHDIASVREFAIVDTAARHALESIARPIVVLSARPDTHISGVVSCGLPTIGAMLPSAPVHHLILAALSKRTGRETTRPVLVVTSANRGGDPLITDNDEAGRELADVADLIVTHDRKIIARSDDSVVRIIASAPALIRRSRGFAPAPVALPHAGPPVLALGGHLKATVCLTRDDQAFLSPHIGDLDHPRAIMAFEHAVARLIDLVGVEPACVAHDLHPDFYSTRFAHTFDVPAVAVQHHHAHIAAVVADNGFDHPVIGLAIDGYGMGADAQSAWGGELLYVDGPEARRIGHLATLAQPGGDAAAHEPWRMAAAALHRMGRSREIVPRFSNHGVANTVVALLERGVYCPETSSCGRLFDAAAGLLGIRPASEFEGAAAMALEGYVTAPEICPNGWRMNGSTLDFLPLLQVLDGLSPCAGANLFHGTLAHGLATWAAQAAAQHDVKHVAVGGGCATNRILVETLHRHLTMAGLTLLTPKSVPANDGGLSFGQAWIAMSQRI